MIDITEIESSPFIIGGAAFSGHGGGYGFGSVEDKVADNIIRQSLDFGVKAIDLAPIYGFGQAEKTVGKLANSYRDQVFLTSKSGVSWHSTKRVNMTNDPKVLQKMLEQSLRDLKTSFIDAYFIHWPDKNVDIRKPMEILSRKKEQGLIRYIGLCNTHAEDYKRASEIDEISILQSEFNLFNNGFDEHLIECARSISTSFWGWGTFDKGIISGSVTRDRSFEKDDCRSWAPWWKKSNKNQKIDLMQKIFKEVKDANGVSLALSHVALSNIKAKPIIGVKSISQFEGVKKSFEQLNEFTSIYQQVISRYFHEQ